MKLGDKIITTGKRKRCVARALTVPGNGRITINRRPYEILPTFQRLLIEEPIKIAEQIIGKINFDISVKTCGGGSESGIEASRLAIARALVEATKSKDLKKVYINYDRSMLVADTRRKEPYKPGDSKARAKRQKSYR